jgi:hypothetical protein
MQDDWNSNPDHLPRRPRPRPARPRVPPRRSDLPRLHPEPLAGTRRPESFRNPENFGLGDRVDGVEAAQEQHHSRRPDHLQHLGGVQVNN